MMAHLDPEVLAGSWREFKSTGSQEARNRLVLHYTSLVRYVATKVGAGLPSMVDRDDLISYGTFGLMDAIEKYDLDKGVKFETYAVARIRGSIIDELRTLDWVPRSIRSKARDIERVQYDLEAELGRPPYDSEVALQLGISVSDLWALLSQGARTTISGLYYESEDEESSYDTNFDPASNPEDLYGAQEITRLLASAVNAMPERSQMILVLYYLQEMTLAEIGQIIGVTESRVSQLQSKVLQSLREQLGHGIQMVA